MPNPIPDQHEPHIEHLQYSTEDLITIDFPQDATLDVDIVGDSAIIVADFSGGERGQLEIDIAEYDTVPTVTTNNGVVTLAFSENQ